MITEAYNKDPMERRRIRTILAKELARRRVRNARYSLRAFARDLDISASHLCEIIHGHHLPSPRIMTQILRNLKQGRQSKASKADEKSFQAYWYHFALADVIKDKKQTMNVDELATTLGISTAEVATALSDLATLGFQRDEEKK